MSSSHSDPAKQSPANTPSNSGKPNRLNNSGHRKTNQTSKQADGNPKHLHTNADTDIQFFGRMLAFTRLQLSCNDLTVIDQQLSQLLQSRDSLIPVIIDSQVEQDLPKLLDLLWSWGLQPIGVGSGILDAAAQTAKLAIFPADGKRLDRIKSTALTAKPNSAQISNNADWSNHAVSIRPPPSLGHHRVYEHMLRSGQSLNHVGGDLILTSSVNDGAEAITDCNLHIYGRAQGRLVAGATGDKDAKIFCQRFNPSLVSVAGTYCLRDNLPTEMIDHAVQVSFQEGTGLVFTLMQGQ